ncbi:MAG: IPExxxVDY family protein [Bacteroidetes bacterium]|nr:IPExxxVDY family protein [Bacteroidota bacterium]
MQKYSLDLTPSFDFSLLSISTQVPDYTMCIELNRLLDIDLECDAPLDFQEKGMSAPLFFSCFSFHDEYDQSDYFLLSNTSNNSVSMKKKEGSTLSLFDETEQEHVKRLLVPELPQGNFLFLLRAENHTKNIYIIQNKIKTLTFVGAVQTIEVETLSSKKNLIL